MSAKPCARCRQNFEIPPEDAVFLTKFEVPEPKLCPDCRSQRRFAFRNDRNFYKRNCDLCKKLIVSICSPDKPFPVYCKDCYLSDQFDPLAYGQDFDFNRPFFDQFAEMRAKVPRVANYFTLSENCDYTVHSGNNRNCYMGGSLVNCENVYYSDWAFYSKDCSDLYLSQNMEKCYECMECEQCYQSIWLENCTGVSFSGFCFDCRSSQNLLGCVGQRQKKFMILNQPVSESEFQDTWKRLLTDSAFRADFVKQFEALRLSIPVKSMWDKNSENCSGNYISNSRNAHHAYAVKDIEDGAHLYEVGGLKDGMDVTRCARGEFLYEVKGAIDLKFSKFTNLCYQSSQLEYCDNCQSSHNNFGCMGLKNHRYCVLNKQYSPEAYAALVEKIKAHMRNTGEYGEFFPMTLSVYGYNETRACDFYPMNKEQALAEGLKWRDPDMKNFSAQIFVTPESIADVPDSVVNEILACEHCRKNYRIIAQELTLYKSLGVPLPRRCYDCRNRTRMAQETPRHLWDRSCARCATAIQTTYSSGRLETVVCEKCYLQNIA